MRTIAALLLAVASMLAAAPARAGGTLEHATVHGLSLEGNLEGDSSARDVYVYQPPSSAGSPERRYPVVYSLHGYGANAEFWTRAIRLPAAIAASASAGSATSCRFSRSISTPNDAAPVPRAGR